MEHEMADVEFKPKNAWGDSLFFINNVFTQVYTF